MPSNNLATLRPGEHATISGIHVEEALHHRLSALGFRIGKRIQLVRRAGFSGPLHIRIGNTEVVMRQTEARHIQITHQPA